MNSIFSKKAVLISILLLLSMGCALYLFAHKKREEDRHEIRNLYSYLRKCILENDATEANKIFSPIFHTITHYHEYVLDRFRYLDKPDYALQENCYIAISSNTAVICPDSNGEAGGIGLYLIKIDGKWYFTGQTILYTD